MNIDLRPLEFGLKEVAKAIRTNAQINKEMAVGKAVVALVCGGHDEEEATELVNKAFAVRDHS
jgi:hypothetical protein